MLTERLAMRWGGLRALAASAADSSSSSDVTKQSCPRFPGAVAAAEGSSSDVASSSDVSNIAGAAEAARCLLASGTEGGGAARRGSTGALWNIHDKCTSCTARLRWLNCWRKPLSSWARCLIAIRQFLLQKAHPGLGRSHLRQHRSRVAHLEGLAHQGFRLETTVPCGT